MKRNILIIAGIIILIICLILVWYYYDSSSNSSSSIINPTPNLTITAKATATITGPSVAGTIYFNEMSTGGTHIWGTITGLNKNQKHGMHIHELGNSTNSCTSMGNHYNPTNQQHGPRDINGVATTKRHLGDLGNIKADSTGVATFNFSDTYIVLLGTNNVIGRGIIITLNTDDLGKGGNAQSLIDGNSGPAVGCGVVSLS